MTTATVSIPRRTPHSCHTSHMLNQETAVLWLLQQRPAMVDKAIRNQVTRIPRNKQRFSIISITSCHLSSIVLYWLYTALLQWWICIASQMLYSSILTLLPPS
jgi:hypothetical protein